MGGVDTRRIDDLVQHHRTGVEVQPDQVVGVVARHLLGGHHKELRAGRIDDRSRGDADGRVDVSAQSGHRGRIERCADMDRPQDGAGVGCQGVHRVVLGGFEYPSGVDQRLSIERPIQGRRGPRPSGRRERVPRHVDSIAGAVLVIGGPARRHHRRRTIGGCRCPDRPGREHQPCADQQDYRHRDAAIMTHRPSVPPGNSSGRRPARATSGGRPSASRATYLP